MFLVGRLLTLAAEFKAQIGRGFDWTPRVSTAVGGRAGPVRAGVDRLVRTNSNLGPARFQ